MEPPPTPVRLAWVPHGGPAWEQTVALRLAVLRAPLGMTFDPAELRTEAADLHLAATLEGVVVGCLVLTPVDPITVRMRQVAVAPGQQRGGIGGLLVHESEVRARAEGYRTMVLHAREPAIPFYLRLGYQLVGEPYVEVGLPHRTLERPL